MTAKNIIDYVMPSDEEIKDELPQISDALKAEYNDLLEYCPSLKADNVVNLSKKIPY